MDVLSIAFPGCLPAIMKDDKLVWSSGYDLAHDEVPVTPDTRFVFRNTD